MTCPVTIHIRTWFLKYPHHKSEMIMNTYKILLFTAIFCISGLILSGSAASSEYYPVMTQYCVMHVLAAASPIPLPHEEQPVEINEEVGIPQSDLNVTTGDLEFGVLDEEDMISGYAIVTDHPIFWKSNAPWTISVSSLNPDLGSSDDGSYIKPLGDLQWRLSGSGNDSWTSLSESPDEIKWENDTGTGIVYVDFRLILEWADDVPGDYSAELQFSIEVQ